MTKHPTTHLVARHVTKSVGILSLATIAVTAIFTATNGGLVTMTVGGILALAGVELGGRMGHPTTNDD